MNGVHIDPHSPLPQSLPLCGWKRRPKEEAPLPFKRPEKTDIGVRRRPCCLQIIV